MQLNPRTPARRTTTRSVGLCALTVAAVALAGCTSGGTDTAAAPGGSGGTGSTSAAPTGSATTSQAVPATPSASAPAVISLVARHQVSPTTPVQVSIKGGHLDTVTMTNAAGTKVTGALSSDHTSWHTTEDLGYAKTYTVHATGTNAAGVATTRTGTVSTLAPANQTKIYFQRIGGYGLTDGATYGVGIVPIVHFDEHITDKAAAEKALTVTTTPHIDGSWYWADDQNVHFRPEHYWPSGTSVTISAKIYGKDLGGGLYGQSDASTSFRIGAKQIAIATDNAPKVDTVKVYRNGTLVRTMNTSMGKHSGTYSGGKYIDFHTMNGTYTVLEHDDPAIMSSASYGLAATDPGGYAPEAIYHATKISTDGIYLHYLSTEYDQDHGIDVSHGCLNLNMSNSIWYYDHSVVGDPVEISGTGGPTIKVWQGGDWSVPWSQWKAGSAL